jgi:hypothetical protein
MYASLGQETVRDASPPRTRLVGLRLENYEDCGAEIIPGSILALPAPYLMFSRASAQEQKGRVRVRLALSFCHRFIE